MNENIIRFRCLGLPLAHLDEFHCRCDDEIKLSMEEELPLLSTVEEVSLPVGPNDEAVENQQELECGDVNEALLDRYPINLANAFLLMIQIF